MRVPNALALSLPVLAGWLLGAGLAAPLAAQVDAPPTASVDYAWDSGWVSNLTDRQQVVIAFPVRWTSARWLRLYFDEVALAGDVRDGSGSFLRIHSIEDGAQQTLNAEHVAQWSRSTAYFNGELVFVEVVAQPGTGPNRVVLRSLDAGLATAKSQCGATDDRVPSNDPRVGRLMPVVCTAWMIDDCNHCFLSAGHCVGSINTVQFNVPLSSSSGALNHPPPEHQYAVDLASIQSNGGLGTGNDWAYFGCFPNSNTGLPAYVAQGSFFTLAPPPPVAGNSIRITGYGADTGVFDNTQQTHVGPFVSDSGTTLGYQTDTQGGNSGSPVIWEQGNVAIGIHTHGGCSSGQNSGTDLASHAAFQAALANPKGICGACGPPTIGAIAPTTLSTFQPDTLVITGANLVGAQTVALGPDVYGPGEFAVIDAGRIELDAAPPAAPGSAAVVVTTSQGASNALTLTWAAADPPQLLVPPFVSGGTSMSWEYGGAPGHDAYLIIAFSGATFPFAGHEILAAPTILQVAPLDAAGLGGLTLQLPSTNLIITFFSQVVTLNGGVTGASNRPQTILFPGG